MRRRTVALQDAGALATDARSSARFWSAPAPRRFGNGGERKAPEDWRTPRRYRAIRRFTAGWFKDAPFGADGGYRATPADKTQDSYPPLITLGPLLPPLCVGRFVF